MMKASKNLSDLASFLAPLDSITASRIRSLDFLELQRPQARRHIVQFYEDDQVIIESVSFLVANSLSNGDSSILIATSSHLRQIEQRLANAGFDLREFREGERYFALDAAETLTQFMVDWPDEAKFNEIVGDLIRHAAVKSTNDFVFAFGEMVALLCAANKPSAAVRLEQLWNNLAKVYRFALWCGYPLSSFGSQPNFEAVLQICAEHSI